MDDKIKNTLVGIPGIFGNTIGAIVGALMEWSLTLGCLFGCLIMPVVWFIWWMLVHYWVVITATGYSMTTDDNVLLTILMVIVHNFSLQISTSD